MTFPAWRVHALANTRRREKHQGAGNLPVGGTRKCRNRQALTELAVPPDTAVGEGGVRLRKPRLIALLLLLLACRAQAAARALLVGVSEYPSLPETAQLQGPRNDIPAFRELLIEHGFSAADITVLADGIPGDGLPTQAAIRAALDAEARRSQAGDYVVLLFSGHGSRQPVLGNDGVPIGIDGIFLPRDIGRWDGSIGEVERAIDTRELGAAVAAIRKRGALVWAIFDTCYAGALLRNARPGEHDRYVTPQELGVPPALLRAAPDVPLATTRGGAIGNGDVKPAAQVSFFAARVYEPTPELFIEGQWRSLFSYQLVRFLGRHPDASYRRTIDAIVDAYRDEGRTSGPIPYLSGDWSQYLAALGGDGEIGSARAEVLRQPLRMAVDRRCGGDAQADEIHALLRDDNVLSDAIVWTAASDSADLQWCSGRQLRVLRAPVFGAQPVWQVPMRGKLPTASLVGTLRRLVPLLRLVRLADRPSGANAGMTMQLIDVAGRVIPDGTGLHPGTRLELRVRNGSAAMRDIVLLHIDPQFQLSQLYPVGDESPRLQAGEEHRLQVEVTGERRGVEHLLMVSVPVRADLPPLDLGHIADDGTRDEPSRAGVAALPALPEVAVFSWETLE